MLTRRGLEQILDALRQTERTVIRALDKGGVVVVEDGGQLITTYSAKSYDRRRARAYVRDRKW